MLSYSLGGDKLSANDDKAASARRCVEDEFNAMEDAYSKGDISEAISARHRLEIAERILTKHKAPGKRKLVSLLITLAVAGLVIGLSMRDLAEVGVSVDVTSTRVGLSSSTTGFNWNSGAAEKARLLELVVDGRAMLDSACTDFELSELHFGPSENYVEFAPHHFGVRLIGQSTNGQVVAIGVCDGVPRVASGSFSSSIDAIVGFENRFEIRGFTGVDVTFTRGAISDGEYVGRKSSINEAEISFPSYKDNSKSLGDGMSLEIDNISGNMVIENSREDLLSTTLSGFATGLRTNGLSHMPSQLDGWRNNSPARVLWGAFVFLLGLAWSVRRFLAD